MVALKARCRHIWTFTPLSLHKQRCSDSYSGMSHSAFKQHVAGTNETNHQSKMALKKLFNLVLFSQWHVTGTFLSFKYWISVPSVHGFYTSHTLKLCDNGLLKMEVPAGVISKCNYGRVWIRCLQLSCMSLEITIETVILTDSKVALN